jgi:hypothetical protein
LQRLNGEELETHYRAILAGLGQGAGLIPVIFHRVQNKIQEPAKLRRLIELIDGETWIGLDIDVKSEIKRQAQNIVREDFWTSTSNKQLNLVQHVKTILNMNGRAAVIVPDNVLFEGGAGEVVRRKLLHGCDVHTMLRLPRASRPTCPIRLPWRRKSWKIYAPRWRSSKPSKRSWGRLNTLSRPARMHLPP